MTELATLSDQQLQDRALDLLRESLPARWQIEAEQGPSRPDGSFGNQLVISNAQGMRSMAALVEVRQTFTPLDARTLMGGPLNQRLRAMAGNTPIVVVAPYLSPRTRQLLAAEDVSYVDLAGNIRLDVQSIYIDIEKASRNPNPSSTPAPGLRGATSGRLARVLVDARPPYTLTAVANAAGVDRGYASRILDSLTDEALIDREPRGKVTDADWQALLRARAQHLDLLGPRAAQGFVSPRGAREALAALSQNPPTELWAVTGSFAAAEVAPVAAPALLVVHTMNPNAIAAELRLLPADEGANVVLIRASNYGPFDRTRQLGGIVWAGLSQVTLDCLSGNGRMPAEGEALVDWMVQNESLWRLPISELPPPAGKS